MRTFVFAIGGTGARVLKSLTMLLASGCEGTSVNDEIIPIIIDYDIENGDTCRTQDILECYQRLHRAAYKTGDQDIQNRIFCTPVQKLKEIVRTVPNLQFNQKSRFEVYLENKDTEVTFKDHIGVQTLNDGNGTTATAHLLEALYDNSPNTSKTAELNLKLDKGFKGCPNIGCVVTKKLTTSTEIQYFLSTVNANDRIFIVGSIFGGTGASGIPMILDLIRQTPKTQNTVVGVLAVTPYFKVNKDGNSAIDSDTFIAKTKAALDAYKLGNSVNRNVNAIYYLGDVEPAVPFANNEGSKEQKNDAHLVEMVGGMCILHFMKSSSIPLNLTGNATAFEFGMKDCAGDASEPLGRNSFYVGETVVPFIDPLAKFVLFNKFCKDYFLVKGEGEKNDTWLRNTGLCKKTDFKKDLDLFIDYFNEWITEMEGAKRPLKLFNVNADYSNLYVDIRTCSSSWRHTKYVDSDKIRENLAGEWKKVTDNGKKTGLGDRPEFLFFQFEQPVLDKVFDDIMHKQ